jgi:(p)ppGpp synthase/HD superfamily hydrolase
VTLEPDRIAAAVELAAGCHLGQVDKAGESYILHPIAVMQRAERYFLLTSWRDDEELRIDVMVAALLHDVVEDSRGDPGQRAILREHIRDRFGARVEEAVYALTRQRNESYEDFITRCTGNQIACLVKRADCMHNVDLTRFRRELTEKDLARRKKYYAAALQLKRALSEFL